MKKVTTFTREDLKFGEGKGKIREESSGGVRVEYDQIHYMIYEILRINEMLCFKNAYDNSLK